MRLSLSFLLIVLFAWSLLPAAHAQDVSVRLTIDDARSGQGFRISGRDGCVIVTASHLFRKPGDTGSTSETGIYSNIAVRDGTGIIGVGSVAFLEGKHDLAIVEVTPSMLDCPAPPTSKQINDAIARGSIHIISRSNRGNQGYVHFNLLKNDDRYLDLSPSDANTPVFRGMSGSPVFAGDTIVGMIVEDGGEGVTTRSRIIRLDHIVRLAGTRLTPGAPRSDMAIGLAASSNGNIDIDQKPPTFRWPATGRIIADFGLGNDNSFSEGIDIQSAPNARIVATANGKVEFVTVGNRGRDSILTIRHGDGWMSTYRVAAPLSVKQDQEVQAGQEIARMPSKGKSDQLVHFEVRFGTKAVDPLGYLPPRGAVALAQTTKASLPPVPAPATEIPSESVSEDISPLPSDISAIDMSRPISTNEDFAQCRAGLVAAGAKFTPIPDQRFQNGCSIISGVKLTDIGVSATNLDPMTCDIATKFLGWAKYGVMPAARLILGSEVERIETFGTFNCRVLAGVGKMSEHGRANAIDVSAFVLADGRRVAIQQAWKSDDQNVRRFLAVVHASACKRFNTVLSPDYNAAHHDHLHFDMGGRGGFCR